MSNTLFERNSGMSQITSTSQKDQGKAVFWKNNTKSVPGSIKPVYGAQHPPLQEMPIGQGGQMPGTPKKGTFKDKQNKNDSFTDFQALTEDAWDDGDDDLIQAASIKMNLRDVHSTAMQVLHDHSEQVRNGATWSPSEAAQQRVTEFKMGTSPKAYTMPDGYTTAPAPPAPMSGGPGLGVRQNTNWHSSRLGSMKTGSTCPEGREASKVDKFKSILSQQNLDINELKKLSWSGIPKQYRPMTWRILAGYVPPSIDRREPTLKRKRQEYFNFIDQYFETRHQDVHSDTFRQIHIDIPRMSPLIPLFQQPLVQEVFERILYIWAIRHPASGYVQGMNDLVTPFFVVFLTEFVSEEVDIDHCDINSTLSQETLRSIEADCYWCFSKLLDGIQDNYTFAQPGIQKKVNALKELVSRIDNSLHEHLLRQHVEYLQFSFRWMNNLLMREMPLNCVIRLWDTYLSEAEGFASFHLYVCAAFLSKFSGDLQRERDFQGLMIMLQNLPTHNWGNEEIGEILAEAFKLKYMFADAPKHLQTKS